MQTRRLLLADVPWLLYRSYFALPKSITGAGGRPVNALLGTVNAILAAIEASRVEVRAVVACMGSEEASYRVELYPPYHAHRDPMPPELAGQWGLAPDLLASLGWTNAASEDLEADDVMFSFALAEQERGGGALILSGDRDMYGAVSESVSVTQMRGGEPAVEIGPQEVREIYGVGPELVPDLIALRGDPSDGLPGAPGVGAKTAASLLREHGSLEAVLAAAGRASPAIRPRIAAALVENEPLLRAFKKIAELQRIEVVLPQDAATDFAGGAAAAAELGMGRLSERLRGLARA
jgi:5'-3' exonuclease